MKLLFLGDVVGKAGRQILAERLAAIQKSRDVDFTIVNVENAAAGRGVTDTLADEILALGVDVLTTGNHVWAQRGIDAYLDSEPRILRPLNFPAAPPAPACFKDDRVPAIRGRDQPTGTCVHAAHRLPVLRP